MKRQESVVGIFDSERLREASALLHQAVRVRVRDLGIALSKVRSPRLDLIATLNPRPTLIWQVWQAEIEERVRLTVAGGVIGAPEWALNKVNPNSPNPDPSSMRVTKPNTYIPWR